MYIELKYSAHAEPHFCLSIVAVVQTCQKVRREMRKTAPSAACWHGIRWAANPRHTQPALGSLHDMPFLCSSWCPSFLWLDVARSRLYSACALLLNSWGSWILQRWPRSWTFNRPWCTRAEQHRVSCRCMPNDASRNSDLGAMQWLRTKEGKRAANSLSMLVFYINAKQACINATFPFHFFADINLRTKSRLNV